VVELKCTSSAYHNTCNLSDWNHAEDLNITHTHTHKYKYKFHTPTNALFIKLDKALKFTIKSLRLAPTCFGL